MENSIVDTRPCFVISRARLVHGAPTTGKTEFVKRLATYGVSVIDSDTITQVIEPRWWVSKGWRDRSSEGMRATARVEQLVALRFCRLVEPLVPTAIFTNLWAGLADSISGLVHELYQAAMINEEACIRVQSPSLMDGMEDRHYVSQSLRVLHRLTVLDADLSVAGGKPPTVVPHRLPISVQRTDVNEMLHLATMRGDQLPPGVARNWARHLQFARDRFKDVVYLLPPSAYAKQMEAHENGETHWSYLNPATKILTNVRVHGGGPGINASYSEIPRAARGEVFVPESSLRYDVYVSHPHVPVFMSDALRFNYVYDFDAASWDNAQLCLHPAVVGSPSDR